MATGMEEGSVCVCVWREMEIISGRLEQVVFKSSSEDPQESVNRTIMLGTALVTHGDGEMAAHSRGCRAVCPDSGAAGQIHKQDSGEGVGPSGGGW